MKRRPHSAQQTLEHFFLPSQHVLIVRIVNRIFMKSMAARDKRDTNTELTISRVPDFYRSVLGRQPLQLKLNQFIFCSFFFFLPLVQIAKCYRNSLVIACRWYQQLLSAAVPPTNQSEEKGEEWVHRRAHNGVISCDTSLWSVFEVLWQISHAQPLTDANKRT